MALRQHKYWSEFTNKQKLFCRHYLSNGFNGTQASISAGYSKNTNVAAQQAKENLRKPHIRDYINSEIDKMQNQIVTLDWKLEMLKKTAEACYEGKSTKESLVDADGVVKCVSELNKMQGDLSPIKTESRVNVENEQEKELLNELIEKNKRDY